MNGDELMFELRGPSGEVWRLYLNGRVEGFPDGTLLINRALPLVQRLVSEKQIPSAHIASQQAQALVS